MLSDRHDIATQYRLRIAFQTILLQALRLQQMARNVFLLCDIHGLRIEETAAILGIAPTAVSLHLAAARWETNSRFVNTTLSDYFAS